MKEKHSPEPWRFCETKDEEWIEDATGAILNGGGLLDEESVTFKNTDSRRIIACVNACVGIPTHVLDKVISEQGGILRDIRNNGVLTRDSFE